MEATGKPLNSGYRRVGACRRGKRQRADKG
jgi:hypothetical protein